MKETKDSISNVKVNRDLCLRNVRSQKFVFFRMEGKRVQSQGISRQNALPSKFYPCQVLWYG